MKAYAWQGDLALRFSPEEAAGFAQVVKGLHEVEYRGQLKELVHWLKSTIPGLSDKLHSTLDPNPVSIGKKEAEAVEQEERRTG